MFLNLDGKHKEGFRKFGQVPMKNEGVVFHKMAETRVSSVGGSNSRGVQANLEVKVSSEGPK